MLYHVYEGQTKSNEHVFMMLKQMCMYKNIFCPYFMKSHSGPCISASAVQLVHATVVDVRDHVYPVSWTVVFFV